MPHATTLQRDSDTVVEDIPDVVERSEPPPPSFAEPPIGDDEGEGPDDWRHPPINNARLGVMLFIGAEAMFFAGLLSAFLVFRNGSTPWPPPFQPRLPIVVTAVNTCFLLWSSYTMHRALRAIHRGNVQKLMAWLGMTAALGIIFLSVQGYEWARLLKFGLTLSSSVYGAIFYTLIGCHAAHVFGAVIWLLIIFGMAKNHRFAREQFAGVQVCGIYWYFVVALWPILFGLVYLY
jgi:heme/copper-type cytochrome/quinol oxidase subunit 3